MTSEPKDPQNAAQKKLRSSLSFFYDQFCVRYVPWLKTPELKAKFLERIPCFDADILQCRLADPSETKALAADLLQASLTNCRTYGRSVCVKFSQNHSSNTKVDVGMEFVYGSREEITNLDPETAVCSFNIALNPYERSAYLHDIDVEANKDDVCMAILMHLSITSGAGEMVERQVFKVPEWEISGAFGWSQTVQNIEISIGWLIAKASLEQQLTKTKFCLKYLRELTVSMVRMDSFYWHFFHQSLSIATELHLNNPSIRYAIMDILSVLPYFLILSDTKEFSDELQEVFIQLNNKPYPAKGQLSKSVLSDPEEDYLEWPEMRLLNLVGLYPYINTVDQFRCSRSLLDHLPRLVKKRAPQVTAFLQMFSQSCKEDLKPKKIITIFRKLCPFIRTIMASPDPCDFMGGCIARNGMPRRTDYEELIRATITMATECFLELVLQKPETPPEPQDDQKDDQEDELLVDPKYKYVCLLMRVAFKELTTESEIEFLNAIIHNLYKRDVFLKNQLQAFRKKNKQRLLELDVKPVAQMTFTTNDS